MRKLITFLVMLIGTYAIVVKLTPLINAPESVIVILVCVVWLGFIEVVDRCDTKITEWRINK